MGRHRLLRVQVSRRSSQRQPAHMLSCALHLVYGRLSDIFGRKNMLQIAVFFLAFGNLLCGFAQTPVQLYVFRAISGMGGGGVNGLALIIVSDLVPLKDRGKYQGYIAAATSFGSAVGPFIGGGLASIGQWRWVFWTTTIVGAVCIVMDYFILPLKPVTGSIKQKLKQIDYLGIFLSAAGTVLLLVPISGGGSTFAWTSALVIGMLVVGAVCMAAFIIVQWRISRLPILPCELLCELHNVPTHRSAHIWQSYSRLDARHELLHRLRLLRREQLVATPS